MLDVEADELLKLLHCELLDHVLIIFVAVLHLKLGPRLLNGSGGHSLLSFEI